MEQLRIRIVGHVQGVFFRAFVRDSAIQLGLKGVVRNESVGSVEVVVQGEKDKLQRLVALCRGGPPLALVDKVEVSKEKVEKVFGNFKME